MKKRTSQELAFDGGVKGWAFMGKSQLEKHIPHAEQLYKELGKEDPERLEVVNLIKKAHKEAKD